MLYMMLTEADDKSKKPVITIFGRPRIWGGSGKYIDHSRSNSVAMCCWFCFWSKLLHESPSWTSATAWMMWSCWSQVCMHHWYKIPCTHHSSQTKIPHSTSCLRRTRQWSMCTHCVLACTEDSSSAIATTKICDSWQFVQTRKSPWFMVNEQHM